MFMLRSFFQNPVWKFSNFCVDSWLPGPSAAFTPTGDAHQIPHFLVPARQWSSRISLCHRTERLHKEQNFSLKESHDKISIIQCQQHNNCIEFNYSHLKLLFTVSKKLFCLSGRMVSKYFPVMASKFHYSSMLLVFFCCCCSVDFFYLSVFASLTLSEDYNMYR